MFPSPAYDGDTYSVDLLVWARRDADGNYVVYPPPEYEFEDVVEHVPEEVAVELHVADRDESVTCSHDVHLDQSTLHVD